MILRMPGLSPLMLDTIRVCMEHHMNFDRTGYPDIQTEWGQATLSRIVAVADCFDAITAHRVYHKRPRSAFEGLQYLFGPARVMFDPAVLWARARTVGLYPPGTVMTTESGYVVLSISPNPHDLRRPNVRVLVQPDGTIEPEENAETWTPMPPSQRGGGVLPPEEHTHNAEIARRAIDRRRAPRGRASSTAALTCPQLPQRGRHASAGDRARAQPGGRSPPPDALR